MTELLIEKKFVCRSFAELDVISEQILGELNNHRVIAFYGEMGAGKTTFIKHLCKKMGVEDIVTSPTFAIMNEYRAENMPVYHFDFYRINSENEAFDLGYEQFFYSGNYCFIEWPEKIQNLLPSSYMQIRISVDNNGERQLKIIV